MSRSAPTAPPLPPAPFYLFGKISAYIGKLLALISGLNIQVAQLWAETREKARPKFKGSKLVARTEKGLHRPEDSLAGALGDPAAQPEDPVSSRKPKGSKTAGLTIHEMRYVEVTQPMPEGSVRVGYEFLTVQDLSIELRNTLVCRERLRAPDGTVTVAELPREYAGRHYGPTLISFILSQHHDCHVSQPRLLEQLREYGWSSRPGISTTC